MYSEQIFIKFLGAARQMAENRELDSLLDDAMGLALDMFNAE